MDLNFEFNMASTANVVFLDPCIMDVAFLISLTHKIFSLSLRWLCQNKILFGDNLGFVYSLELALVK